MLRRLSAGLLATAAFVAPLPAIAQEGSAGDLGVMSISQESTEALPSQALSLAIPSSSVVSGVCDPH